MRLGLNRSMALDVIIIGAGVIGSSIALGLSRKGFSTLNVDALPAAGYGGLPNLQRPPGHKWTTVTNRPRFFGLRFSQRF
jgi:glycine/D-amino acid oxidase-like deaminating enzyme